jgi:hypothetical protein
MLVLPTVSLDGWMDVFVCMPVERWFVRSIDVWSEGDALLAECFQKMDVDGWMIDS